MEFKYWPSLVALVIVLVEQCSVSYSARILAVFPVPSISHQVVFRPLTQELARRGHAVTVVTTDPVFPKGKSPTNLTEIDIHDASYKFWREQFVTNVDGKKENHLAQISGALKIFSTLFEMQMSFKEILSVLKMKPDSFDLLLVEAVAEPFLMFAHIFNIPAIQISSLGAAPYNHHAIGAQLSHPILYPNFFHQKINNLTILDKIKKTLDHFKILNMISNFEATYQKQLQDFFGEGALSAKELRNLVDMLFLNIHPIWEGNFPVPPGVVYIWGIHKKPQQEIPQNLKSILDSSKHGVIYMSFGTNAVASSLPPEKIATFVKVFSKLPYHVIWKWEKDELPNKTANIHIGKWFPQADLLRHPKVKLFITQGGIQSTDEAIEAGVPLIGVPMLADQWYNVEKYVTHGIGVRLDFDDVTEDLLRKTIENVIGNERYCKNIAKLRMLMHDQPQSALERAVWWTEHVIRHGGARHLRAPAANLSWVEVYEVKLLSGLLTALFVLLLGSVYVCKLVIRWLGYKVKVKKS